MDSTAAGTPVESPPNVRIVSSLRPDDERYNVSHVAAMKALSAAEDRHFWHLSRNAFIEGRLRALGVRPPDRVLELGCGGGCVAAHLAAVGFSVTGIDGHLPRILEAAARAPGADFVVYDLSHGTSALGMKPHSGAVGLFDVIEHLDTPRAVLEDALRLVSPGGIVAGTVPALMGLWTHFDEYAGHRLRYERAGLSALLQSVRGAELIEIVDFNRHLVPMIWLQRRFAVRDSREASAEASLKVPAAPLNTTLLFASRLERFFDSALRSLPLPGASLWFALRRL